MRQCSDISHVSEQTLPTLVCKCFPPQYTFVLPSCVRKLTYSNTGQMSLATRGQVVSLWKSGLTVFEIHSCLQEEESVERLFFVCGQLLCSWIRGARQSVWWSDREIARIHCGSAWTIIVHAYTSTYTVYYVDKHTPRMCAMQASMHQECFTDAKDVQGTANVLVRELVTIAFMLYMYVYSVSLTRCIACVYALHWLHLWFFF